MGEGWTWAWPRPSQVVAGMEGKGPSAIWSDGPEHLGFHLGLLCVDDLCGASQPLAPLLRADSTVLGLQVVSSCSCHQEQGTPPSPQDSPARKT